MKRMAMAKQNSLDDYQPDLDDGDDDFEDTPDQSGTYAGCPRIARILGPKSIVLLEESC